MRSSGETISEMTVESKTELSSSDYIQSNVHESQVSGPSDTARVAGFIAHELRQPLGVIQNLVYYLRNAVASTHPTVLESINLLEQQASLADNILSSLLEFSRSGMPRKTNFDLRSLTHEVLNRFASEGGISIECQLGDFEAYTFADQIHVDRILSNLIANAVESMEGEGSITVRLFQERNAMVVEITDSGCGISSEDAGRLFQQGFTTKASGTGLGLILCRELAAANGGSLCFKSKPGIGTTFELRLSSV